MRALAKISPLLALAAAYALAGCGEGPRSAPNPLDRLVFPSSMAVTTLPGGRRVLVVVSSNFDLRYGEEEGGSVLVVDPDLSTSQRLEILGRAVIPSFGGELALLDPAACPGHAAQVLVPVREENALFRVDLGADGSLSLGPGHRIDLDPSVADPYAVAVTCRTRPDGTTRADAWVSHLRAPRNLGFLSHVDLATAGRSLVGVGQAPSQGLAYDAVRDRLYVTSRFAVLDQTPLTWIELATGAVAPPRNLASVVRGADLTALALSADGTRAYAAVRLFDRDFAASVNGRTGDVGGALAVIDLSEQASGGPAARIVRLVPVGVGPGDVELLPRGPGLPDLVVVSNTDEGTVSIYDDASGAVVRVIGADDAGRKAFGEEPFALASARQPDGKWHVYVASFDRGFVVPIEVDPAAPSRAKVLAPFGPEAP